MFSLFLCALCFYSLVISLSSSYTYRDTFLRSFNISHGDSARQVKYFRSPGYIQTEYYPEKSSCFIDTELNYFAFLLFNCHATTHLKDHHLKGHQGSPRIVFGTGEPGVCQRWIFSARVDRASSNTRSSCLVWVL